MWEIIVAFVAGVALVGTAAALWIRLVRLLEAASREAVGGASSESPRDGRREGSSWERS
jgi:hypothetical protein